VGSSLPTLPELEHLRNAAARQQDRFTTATMASSIEQSPFFQQRKSKGELIVKGLLDYSILNDMR
jgi:hypothetical protein